MENLGKNLTVYRTRCGLSQQQLAAQLLVHQSTIGGIEAGHRRPSLEMALKLARFFNVSVEELAGEATEPEAEYA